MADLMVHNTELAEAAIQYVKSFHDIADYAPRFDIHYEGFGSGGTMNVTAQYAARFLRNLAAADDPHYRYRTAIKSLTVRVRYPEFVIS